MKLFNSMSRKKEEFVPITPGEVKMRSEEHTSELQSLV